MATILYLVHRLPYPPDKGERARSYHTLRHLSASHRVLLGTFIDNPGDAVHVDHVRAMCGDCHVARLDPRLARLASARGLLTGQPLTLPYYHDRGLATWVRQVTQGEAIDATLVFSSCMAQYAGGQDPARVLVDFVDVDSAKWAGYADLHRWPMSWVYRREGRKLLDWERSIAARAAHSFFVTEKETALFQNLAPESRERVSSLSMGIDAEHFAPDAARASPFTAGEIPLVFTGSMDYWPNVDAVVWFVREVLPELRRQHPSIRFHIVGRNPAPAVRALAGEAVAVTGTVPDVRPYLQHAAVVVAPLRLARGLQTKLLEAMAMARPVVAAAESVAALTAVPGHDLMSAGSAGEYLQAIEALLQQPQRAEALGAAGRSRVLESYAWAAHLRQLDTRLQAVMTQSIAPRPAAHRVLEAT